VSDRERLYIHFTDTACGAERAIEVDRLCATLRRGEVGIESVSKSGIVVAGHREQLSKTLHCGIRTVLGERGPVRVVESADSQAAVHDALIATIIPDHPLVSCANWRDPNEAFVGQHFESTWNMGSSYDPLNGTQNLMFFSDVAQVMEAPYAYNFSMHTGEGVSIYMIDTGVDTQTDFFLQFGQQFDISEHLEIRSCLEAYDSHPELLGDFNGHGTMCAAGALGVAYGARVVMYTVPKTWDTLFGVLSLVDFLGAFGRIRYSVSSNSPAVLSISRGLSALDFQKKDGTYLPQLYETVAVFRDHLNGLLDKGVVTFASAGNEFPEHKDLVPSQMSEVLSVGGAFPLSLEKLYSEENSFHISNYSVSGTVEAPLANPDIELATHGGRGRSFPDLCGLEGSLGKSLSSIHHRVRSNPTIVQTSEVSICFPVSRGLNEADWDAWMKSFPPAEQAIADAIQESGCAPDNESCIETAGDSALLEYLPLLYSLSPMDLQWMNSGGTEQDDGWAVGPGGTSLATAFCAGVFALGLDAFPGFPISYFSPPVDIAQLRALLYSSCRDVGGGKNAVGEFGVAGKPDRASGAGVLVFSLLRATLLGLQPLMDLSGIDRFVPDLTG